MVESHQDLAPNFPDKIEGNTFKLRQFQELKEIHAEQFQHNALMTTMEKCSLELEQIAVVSTRLEAAQHGDLRLRLPEIRLASNNDLDCDIDAFDLSWMSAK